MTTETSADSFLTPSFPSRQWAVGNSTSQTCHSYLQTLGSLGDLGLFMVGFCLSLLPDLWDGRSSNTVGNAFIQNVNFVFKTTFTVVFMMWCLRAQGDNGFNTKPHEWQAPMVSAESQSDWEIHRLLHLAGLHAGYWFGCSSKQLGEHTKCYVQIPNWMQAATYQKQL